MSQKNEGCKYWSIYCNLLVEKDQLSFSKAVTLEGKWQCCLVGHHLSFSRSHIRESQKGLILDHWQFRSASRQALKGLPEKD